MLFTKWEASTGEICKTTFSKAPFPGLFFAISNTLDLVLSSYVNKIYI